MRTPISLLLLLALSPSTLLATRTITTTITADVSTTTIYHTIASSTSIETSVIKSVKTSVEASPSSSSSLVATSPSSSSAPYPTTSKSVVYSIGVARPSNATQVVIPSSSAPFPTETPTVSETGTLATGAPVSPPTSFPGPTSGVEGRAVNLVLGGAMALAAGMWGLC